MEIRKRRSTAGQVIGIIICVVLFITALAIGLLGLMSNKDGETPNVFGYSVYTANIHMDSIPSHSAIIADRAAVPEPGQAVVFRNDGSMAKDMSVAYMAEATDVSIVVSADGALYDVAEDDVRGVAIGYVPVLGSVISVAQSVYGGLLFILLAFFMLLLVIMFGFKISERKAENAAICEAELEDELEEAIETESDEDEEEEEEEYIPARERRAREGLYFTDDIVSEEPKAAAGMVAAASGNVDDNYISLIVNASEEEIGRIKTVLENGLKQKSKDEWEVKRMDGAQPTLAIRCSWQDLAVVSLLISALKKAR